MMNYFALFCSAFLAATLLPMQSELLLLGLLKLQQNAVIGLIAVASVGNVLGSCVNWYLGGQLERFYQHRLFPFNAEQIEKAQRFYQKYGWWSLFLSWLPMVGDPLTLIAGVLKERFWRFLLVVGMAKTARYVSLYYLYVVWV